MIYCRISHPTRPSAREIDSDSDRYEMFAITTSVRELVISNPGNQNTEPRECQKPRTL